MALSNRYHNEAQTQAFTTNSSPQSRSFLSLTGLGGRYTHLTQPCLRPHPPSPKLTVVHHRTTTEQRDQSDLRLRSACLVHQNIGDVWRFESAIMLADYPSIASFGEKLDLVARDAVGSPVLSQKDGQTFSPSPQNFLLRTASIYGPAWIVGPKIFYIAPFLLLSKASSNRTVYASTPVPIVEYYT